MRLFVASSEKTCATELISAFIQDIFEQRIKALEAKYAELEQKYDKLQQVSTHDGNKSEDIAIRKKEDDNKEGGRPRSGSLITERAKSPSPSKAEEVRSHEIFDHPMVLPIELTLLQSRRDASEFCSTDSTPRLTLIWTSSLKSLNTRPRTTRRSMCGSSERALSTTILASLRYCQYPLDEMLPHDLL